MRLRTRLLAVLAVGAGGLLLAGLVQGPPQDQPTVSSAPPAPETDRVAFRARLERRLDETKRLQERLEGAIKRLDEGESTERVRNDVEPQRGRPREGGREPAGRGDRPHWDGPGGPGEKPGADKPRLDKAAVMEFLKQNNPTMAQRMEDVLKDNPAIGERIIGRIEPQVRDIVNEKDAETREARLAELNNGFETVGAMRQYGEAVRAGQSTSEIESRLRTLIGQHFDLQLKLREREISHLEGRLTQLHKEVDERRPQRESFVNERMEQIKKGAMRRGKPGDGPPPPPPGEGRP